MRDAGKPVPRSRRGKAAEEAAVRRLQDMGYQILTRNFRGRRGEIDVVARDGCCIAFVEVKARRWVDDSMAAVDWRKRRRLVGAALEYLAIRRLSGVRVRFDVVAVGLDKNGAPDEIVVLKDAFGAKE
ncbi:MAG: YraN family protein [Firmicutes bacterium]|nr:YraN family protein [Bacillota bacterium]